MQRECVPTVLWEEHSRYVLESLKALSPCSLYYMDLDDLRERVGQICI